MYVAVGTFFLLDDDRGLWNADTSFIPCLKYFICDLKVDVWASKPQLNSSNSQQAANHSLKMYYLVPVYQFTYGHIYTPMSKHILQEPQSLSTILPLLPHLNSTHVPRCEEDLMIHTCFYLPWLSSWTDTETLDWNEWCNTKKT